MYYGAFCKFGAVHNHKGIIRDMRECTLVLERNTLYLTVRMCWFVVCCGIWFLGFFCSVGWLVSSLLAFFFFSMGF